MKLPRLAIENSQFTVVVFLLLLLMGLFSFISMPRTEDPPVYIPGASVIVIYPGANPNDLEQLIANPVEESINELDDIKTIETKLVDGIVNTAVEFNFETDADKKYEEVIRQINSIRDELPDDIYSLSVEKWSSTDVSILQLAFVSDSAPLFRLEEQVKGLKKELEKIKGVKTVEIHAAPEQEVRVSLDMEKMANMDISINNVARIILSNNANIPGGSIKIGAKNFNIKTSGSFNTLDDIKNTVIGFENGQTIYLRDIADVKIDYEDQKYFARFQGEKSVFLTVEQKANLNIFDIKEEIDKKIEGYYPELDPGTSILTVFDQTESVDERINGFLNNLVQGIILVGIVIFLALGFRASILVIIAIPLSILMGLGFVDLSGFGLQQVSIAALVIALGLLVDNSIVIVENIERFIRKGSSREEAAIGASAELGWPILSATVTTMLAFIPIIMMPDKAGAFVESLPVTVIFTLASSLLLALTFTPYLASIFLKKKKSTSPDSKGIKKLMQGFIDGPYQRSLQWALKKHTWGVVLISLLLFAGASGLFFQIGVSFFPKAEKPQFMIRVNAPESTNIDNVNKIAEYVESVLDTIPLVEKYASNVGHGNPRIYYNIFPRFFTKNYAEIFVELKKYDVEEFDALVANLRHFFGNNPAARIEIKEFEQGVPIEAPLTIKITGENVKILEKLADDVETIVRNTDGVLNIDNQLKRRGTDIYFNINREKAGMLGVPISEIDKTIRTAIAGSAIAKFRDNEGEEYDIVLRLPIEDRVKLEDFDKIHVPSLSGMQIPLNMLAHMEFREAPGIISHYNLSRAATITGDIQKGYFLDDIIDGIEEELVRYTWPRGYDYQFTGELESRQESFGGMLNASLIALIAIFAVLVLQFRSFSQPLIIYSAIPLAVIGSTLALFITGYSFSFTAFIGLISLIGIVVNNSIILVDYTNQLLKEGYSQNDALNIAGKTRFTPIVLTTLTTIGGLLPLTLQGGTLWAPMGWTIIGGLLVSTLLTLIVVPVLYKILTPDKKLKTSGLAK